MLDTFGADEKVALMVVLTAESWDVASDSEMAGTKDPFSVDLTAEWTVFDLVDWLGLMA